MELQKFKLIESIELDTEESIYGYLKENEIDINISSEVDYEPSQIDPRFNNISFNIIFTVLLSREHLTFIKLKFPSTKLECVETN